MNISRESLKRRWWIFFEIALSIIIVLFGSNLLANLVIVDYDPIQFNILIGGDALALMGFIIQALAIIGALVDRKVLDTIRGHPSFKDLWLTFVISAICLGVQALIGRIILLITIPQFILWFSSVLAIFNAFLILDCILLLAQFITLVNQGRSLEIALESTGKKKQDLK